MMNIIELAKEAWGENHEIFWFDDNGIERFYKLVRKATIADMLSEYLPRGFRPHSERMAELEADADKKEAIDAARQRLKEKQEPVAQYKDAPHTIYLQTGCDDPGDCECSFNEWGDTTWCADQIHDTDIPYIRADYAAPVDAKAIRAEALEEAAEWCEAKQSYNAMHANTEFAAAIRGLK